MNSASRRERLLAGLLGGLTAALVALTVGLVLVILARGLPQVGALLNQGGLGAAALGTIGLTLITALVAAPFGVATAITLSELGQTGRLARGLRFGLGTLAGVPGVVWGLFGLVVFVQGLALGPSLLAAGLTRRPRAEPHALGLPPARLVAPRPGGRLAQLRRQPRRGPAQRAGSPPPQEAPV